MRPGLSAFGMGLLWVSIASAMAAATEEKLPDLLIGVEEDGCSPIVPDPDNTSGECRSGGHSNYKNFFTLTYRERVRVRVPSRNPKDTFSFRIETKDVPMKVELRSKGCFNPGSQDQVYFEEGSDLVRRCHFRAEQAKKMRDKIPVVPDGAVEIAREMKPSQMYRADDSQCNDLTTAEYTKCTPYSNTHTVRATASFYSDTPTIVTYRAKDGTTFKMQESNYDIQRKDFDSTTCVGPNKRSPTPYVNPTLSSYVSDQCKAEVARFNANRTTPLAPANVTEPQKAVSGAQEKKTSAAPLAMPATSPLRDGTHSLHPEPAPN